MANIKIIVKKLIDIHIKGVDSYVNNGSLWLIFTEEKKWVIELTKDGTLWYNYNFFSKIFKLISMNVVENQHYITRWVEDALQNGVKHTFYFNTLREIVEDTVQNGVKYTSEWDNFRHDVEDTVQNGVKETLSNFISSDVCVEDIIQNGVKEVQPLPAQDGNRDWGNYYHRQKDRTKPHTQYVDDVIENGIKEKL